jgi:hypothetical protein
VKHSPCAASLVCCEAFTVRCQPSLLWPPVRLCMPPAQLPLAARAARFLTPLRGPAPTRPQRSAALVCGIMLSFCYIPNPTFDPTSNPTLTCRTTLSFYYIPLVKSVMRSFFYLLYVMLYSWVVMSQARSIAQKRACGGNIISKQYRSRLVHSAWSSSVSAHSAWSSSRSCVVC